LSDEDNANPNLSTGNYKYAATTETLEKSEANHFRRNETDTVKDVVVSLEKTIADGKYNVLVRSIKTKIITYQGLVVKGQTKAEHMNNNKQNVKIMKLFSLENDKPRPDLLKIQFREAFDGAAFMKALQKCL
jgi:transketolase C-terminal domain/subunit